MRIVVNCAAGAAHSLMLLEQTTVQDVKEFVGDRESRLCTTKQQQ